VISRWQSYHGNTLGALAYSGLTGRRRKHAPALHGVVHIPPAFCYRCPFEKTLPECELLCARALETAILQAGPENVSAFIADPVVGASLAGSPAPPGYFQKIREICTRHGVLFVADEVMCGLGRTGANFAIDHWGVVPDLISIGKGMGSGYFPMAACLLSDAVVNAVSERKGAFEGVHTCCGHLLGSRVTSAVLDYVQRHRLVENAREQGKRLLDGLREMQGGLRSVGDVRGLGLMCGVEFVKDRATKEPFPPTLRVAERVFDACMERGLIVYPGHGTVAGTSGDHILIGPPLVITAGQVDDLLSGFREAIISVEKMSPT